MSWWNLFFSIWFFSKFPPLLAFPLTFYLFIDVHFRKLIAYVFYICFLGDTLAIMRTTKHIIGITLVAKKIFTYIQTCTNAWCWLIHRIGQWRPTIAKKVQWMSVALYLYLPFLNASKCTWDRYTYLCIGKFLKVDQYICFYLDQSNHKHPPCLYESFIINRFPHIYG